MALTTSEEVVDAATRNFLMRHGAELEFRKIIELVRACFPELLGLEVALHEDPDEEGRAQAVLRVKLSESFPDGELQSALRRYHERLIKELPLSQCPLFALVTEFGPE
jgi:hypothetical protein